jgi:uncharacterized phage protein gp47/JayE
VSSYIDLPIDTDPQDIVDDFVTFMQSVIPGWQPSPAQLDLWLAQAMSISAAEARDVASRVPRSIFRWYGANLVQLPPLDDTPAATTTTWTLSDALGHTIPLGTQVSLAKNADELYAFETTVDVVVAPGSTVAADVPIVAVTPGADSSGVGTAGSVVTLLDPLAWVTSITQVAVTTGGIDAEDDDTYLNRLAAYLTLIAPRPILAPDFAIFARNIAGVYRAVGIDLYDPGPPIVTNSPRTVSIAAIDIAGNPLDSAHKASVIADLQGRREANFKVFVIDPTINQFDVTYQVKVLAGYVTTQVVTAVNAALTGYLSQATWGTTPGDPTAWTNQTIVRYLEIAQVINAVAGVDYITTTGGNLDLQIGIHGSGLVRADVVLTGIAPLPRANTLTGTAV